MAINFCSVDQSTIDSFCGGRRRVVLDRLIAEKYPVVSVHPAGGGRAVRDTFAVQPPFEFEDRPTLNFEQPWITVEVEFDGKKSSQTLDNDVQQHFVSVTGFLDEDAQVSEQVAITVNITHFEI